jgi:hypothetical protein
LEENDNISIKQEEESKEETNKTKKENAYKSEKKLNGPKKGEKS